MVSPIITWTYSLDGVSSLGKGSEMAWAERLRKLENSARIYRLEYYRGEKCKEGKIWEPSRVFHKY